MAGILYVGNFTRKIDQRKIQIIQTRDEVDNVPLGAHIRRWDYVTEVDDDLLPPSKLLHLRSRSDKFADDVVEYLQLKPGVDALQAIENHLASTETKSQAVVDFWAAVNMEPPQEVSAFSTLLGEDRKERGTEECTPGEAMERNERRPAPTLAEGQAVFWRYSSSIFGALLHFSLAGGFTSPNLSAVMQETNYLTSDSLNATYYRLLETSLFVGDAMRDMRVGAGKGWRSAIRVRLLHAQVRMRIKSKRGKFNVYDEKVSGIPINQEDLCAVLGSFMIAPIWSMERAGIHLTVEERSAYQAAWRHVGFYLGVDVDLLKRFYGGSYSTAAKSFASMAFDVFPSVVPEDGYKTSTYRMLSAVSNRPPRNTPVTYHLEYARRLLGDNLSDQLNLPRGTWRDRFGVEFDIIASKLLVEFGRVYRKGWDLERQQLFAQVFELLVVWQLGSRRSTFAWREEASQAKALAETEGEDAGIPMGVKVGLAVKSRWMYMLAELVAVVGTGCIGIAVGGLIIWKKVS